MILIYMKQAVIVFRFISTLLITSVLFVMLQKPLLPYGNESVFKRLFYPCFELLQIGDSFKYAYEEGSYTTHH